MPCEPRTLLDRLWDAHVVVDLDDDQSLLYIDLPVSYTHLTLPTILLV